MSSRKLISELSSKLLKRYAEKADKSIDKLDTAGAKHDEKALKQHNKAMSMHVDTKGHATEYEKSVASTKKATDLFNKSRKRNDGINLARNKIIHETTTTLRLVISEMIGDYLEEARRMPPHDAKKPEFHSVDHYADTVSDLTKPHEENIKTLDKQKKYHKSNFKSAHPNSHKFLHQEAHSNIERSEYHLNDIHKKGPWEVHDFKGKDVTHEVGKYSSHLNHFHHDPDGFEKSIKKTVHGPAWEVPVSYTRTK